MMPGNKKEPVTESSNAPLRVIFMGTPDFAVASLDALINAGYLVVAVITAPDKPAGRGMKLTESPVKKYALEKGLTVLQPEKLKNPLFIENLKALAADIQVVVAFRMLPELVWNMPPLGTINLHGSLLPQYRGAAPINWAVINGEKETGVTTFRLQHEIDTGNILLQESFPIGDHETAGDVHERMKDIGAALLVKTLNGLVAGILKEQPQSALVALPELKQAPKIFTLTGKIDWTQPASEIYNLIRGLSPFPAAFTFLQDKMLKIYKSSLDTTEPVVPPGEMLTDHKTYLKFAAADGYIRVTDIQLEGKKRMTTDEFLRGYRF
ncbi:MAG: methionyl-tRNA formyltransferase [Bacteroidota bacterium]